jgi:urease accessory protein
VLEIVERLAPASPTAAQATVSLPWEQRHRSRLRVRLDDGRQAALMLPRGTSLQDGDLLATSQGIVVRVLATAEELSLVACADAVQLARACYHLGNRHVPVQIRPDGVSYQRDHVLDAMLRGLGLEPRALTAVFEPEAGAYHGHNSGHHG